MLVVLVVVAAGSWYPARSAEFRCGNGALERRIELSGPDDTQGTACEVRYWRDASAPGSGRVLWRAQQDPDFCAAKARELVTRLEAGGWTCGPGEQPASPEPTDARADDPPPVAAAPAQAAPAAVVRDEPAAPSRRRRPPCARTRQHRFPTHRRAAVRDTRGAASGSGPQTDPRQRGAVVWRRVPGGTRGIRRPRRRRRAGCRRADHLQAQRNEYVQYLVAYLFDGETFQSVATRNVGGRFLDALRAALRGIDDGRILVELEALDEVPRVAPRAGPRSFWTAASWSSSPMRAGPMPGRPARPDRRRPADRSAPSPSRAVLAGRCGNHPTDNSMARRQPVWRSDSRLDFCTGGAL